MVIELKRTTTLCGAILNATRQHPNAFFVRDCCESARGENNALYGQYLEPK